jgi:predicted XRE-type DNA-binding protein
LGSFVKRLDIYTKIDLTPIMTDIIVKIMLELLSVLALATKQITQKRFSKCTVAHALSIAQCTTVKFAKKLLGETEIEAILQRLDRLTQDEARTCATETLRVVHGLVGNVKEIMEGVQCLNDRSQVF